MHIKKGDKVKVITGADKGKTGIVREVLTRAERVVVEGVNLKKKHERAKRGGQKGQMVERALPIHISNVARVS